MLNFREQFQLLLFCASFKASLNTALTKLRRNVHALQSMEKTLALIKPDAVRAGKTRSILRWIEREGFAILAQREMLLSRCMAEAFYQEHKERPFFAKLVDFMTGGPLVAAILARENAVKKWRGLMGPTNAAVARQEAPESIRGVYGTDGTQNAVHGSDSHESAKREMLFFFPRRTVDLPMADNVEGSVEGSWQKLSPKLELILTEALTMMAKTKPTGNIYESVQFLGKWLLENNPNKGKRAQVNTVDTSILTDPIPLPKPTKEAKVNRITDSCISPEEAAIKVQAVYRGYRVRKQPRSNLKCIEVADASI